MTSKVSNKKLSPVTHNFMCGLKSKTKMAIIIGILHLAAAPAIVLAAIISVYRGSDVDAIGTFAVIGVITTALAGFMGILIAIDSFSCLHNKSVVDMRLSLPLTANQRFFSNFLSGLAAYIGPFLAAQVISMLGMAYGLAFMDGRTMERKFSNDFMKYECHYFSQFMPVLLKLIVAGILTMLMLYTLTVLVTVCCGNKFESIAYTILINIMIPLTLYLVFMSMFNDLYGINCYDVLAKLLIHTSPAGGIAAAAEWSTGEPIISFSKTNYALWAVIYILLTAAMGAAAFFLYKKRRAEQVSKPFVFKSLYYVITTAAVFCIYSVFYYNHTGIVPAILTTAIVYFILEVIANRGFRKIWLSLVKYVGAMAASALLIFSAQKTEGFGMVTRVPDISQVKSVSLDYSGFYSDFELGYDRETNEAVTLTFTERENIETIIAAHQGRVDKRKDGFFGVGGRLYVTYELKNGRMLKREYGNMPAEETEILSKLDLTDEFKTQVAEIYKTKIFEAVEDYHRNEEYYTNNPSLNKAALTSVSSKISGNESSVRISTLMGKNFYEQLAEAYAKDIMNISEENYYSSDLKNVYYFSNGNSGFVNLSIPENFTNTLELMEQFGFDIGKKEDISDMDLYEYLTEAAKSGRVSIYTAEEWRYSNEIPTGVRLHAQYNNSSRYDERVYKIDKDICDLYRAAEPMNIVPDNGYIIYVFGKTAVIPEELNAAAERVYAGRTRYDESEHYENETPFWLESTDEVIIPQEVPEGTTAYYVYD